MKKRINLTINAVAIVVALLTAVLICVLMYSHFYRLEQQELIYSTRLFEDILENSPTEYAQQLKASTTLHRVTLIDTDGTVLYDNEHEAQTMDNHATRPEISTAYQFGAGESTRYSDTLGTQTFYYAVRLDNGQVLRLAVALDSVFSVMIGVVLPFILLILAIVIALSAFAASRATKRIIAPLNSFEIGDFAMADVYPEMSPFILKIKKQSDQISEQMRDLSHRQQRFSTVVEHMGEGLILTDSHGELLFVNSYAKAIFGMKHSDDYSGKSVLDLGRSLEMNDSLKAALAGEKIEQRIVISESELLMYVTPVAVGGTVEGVVIMLDDVTEQHEAERMRREFSANVSHELKTPLTSISGYAEMIKGGMVEHKDVVPFAEKIHAEANRLLALIGDIIRLSRLDEGVQSGQFEQVSLPELCKQTVQRLERQAEKAKVSINLDLEQATVRGMPNTLQEVVDNLCENAIKYNREGGKVDISTKVQDGMAVLTVSDSGIGIPPSAQKRVFERFYRVDKSHSKDTGGTGLGLSIVKHGVEHHSGTVSLESTEHGTTVTVKLPL